MAVILYSVLRLGLFALALLGLSRSEPSERMGISRFAWVPVIVLLPVLGPLIWILLTRLPRESGAGPSTGSSTMTGTQANREMPIRSLGSLRDRSMRA